MWKRWCKSEFQYVNWQLHLHQDSKFQLVQFNFDASTLYITSYRELFRDRASWTAGSRFLLLKNAACDPTRDGGPEKVKLIQVGLKTRREWVKTFG